MPTIQVNGCQYHYEEHGSGKETILFSHGLLWSGHLFHKQVDFLKDRYRIITYDHRGQGKSEVTPSGYDMDQLYEDTVQLIEQLQLGKVHMIGLSMGGFVTMRLAARRPDLVRSAILMETSAQEEPYTFKYNMLVGVVRLFGIKSVTSRVMKIMFGQKFLNDPARKEEKRYWANQLNQNKKTIIRAVKGVIERKGIEDELANIQCPTLILVGTQDVATTPEKSEFMQAHIPNSKLVYIDGGGHTSSIEEPEQCNAAIDAFLRELG
jgi:3-oxoadipate enol-lactonase